VSIHELDPAYDYWVALVIGLGIALFMADTENLKIGFGYNIYDQRDSAFMTGIMLLVFYLIFDSFTSQWQSRMFQRHRDLSMIELMFATSAFSSLLSLITLIHSHELGPAVDFVLRHSEIHLHFLLFSICSTVGQLLIFYTIKNFGAVIFTIIMTTRVLLSIALSCYIYGHTVTEVGFFGMVFVMGAIMYRVKKKAEGSQLIKWRGLDDSKAEELVHEWHEHADM
jgi:adenosine 3'-phospho 5'-phosphosulfate transporter B2